MLHKLSSRNAPEARRWRLAQENLDEAYVHRTLSPDFLSKSSDSGFWSKRQRFRPKVYATLGYTLATRYLRGYRLNGRVSTVPTKQAVRTATTLAFADEFR